MNTRNLAIIGGMTTAFFSLLTVPAAPTDDESERSVSPVVRVGSLGGMIWSWAEQGAALYVGQGDRLLVFDQTHRDQPNLIAQMPLFYSAQAMTISTSTLYVAEQGYSSRWDKFLTRFDIGNRGQPVEQEWNDDEPPGAPNLDDMLAEPTTIPAHIMKLSTGPKDAQRVLVSGDWLWCREGQKDWLLIDVADRAAPKVAGTVRLAGDDQPLAFAAGKIFATGSAKGLRVYDGTRAGECRQEGRFELTGKIEDFALEGNLAYIAAGADGLFIVDVAEPARPRLLAQHRTAFPCLRVAAAPKRAAVLADDLFLFDTSDATRPRLACSLWVSDRMTTEAMVEAKSIGAQGSLREFDISAETMGLIWEDSNTGGRYVQWVDITDLSNPKPNPTDEENSFYDAMESIRNFGRDWIHHDIAHNTQLHDNYLEFLREPGTNTPAVLGSDHGRFAEIADYAFDGGFLYVADGINGVVILKFREGKPDEK